jgi:hypothetical protein
LASKLLDVTFRSQNFAGSRAELNMGCWLFARAVDGVHAIRRLGRDIQLLVSRDSLYLPPSLRRPHLDTLCRRAVL